VVTLAACGTSSGPSTTFVTQPRPGTQTAPAAASAASSSANSQGIYQQELTYAACIRAHGEPGFPYPTPGENPRKFAKPKGIKHGTPQFQSAARACKADLPTGGKGALKLITGDQKALLSFAACLRANGVPNFPDPSMTSGVYGFGDLKSKGIDRKSPLVKAAFKHCRPLLSSVAGTKP
jgi:hypothetical protein